MTMNIHEMSIKNKLFMKKNVAIRVLWLIEIN